MKFCNTIRGKAENMLIASFSGFDPGCVKTPTLNLRVEFPARFRRCGKPIALATSVRRRQLRKQFCASLAQASFHTASDPQRKSAANFGVMQNTSLNSETW